MSKSVVFISGRNPLEGKGGGGAYVRAHARAAIRAGYEPHVFCVARTSGVIECDFGVVHRVSTPFHPPGSPRFLAQEDSGWLLIQWSYATVYSPYLVALHGPKLADAVEQFLHARSGPHLIHGFYTWGCVGITVRQRLQKRGIKAFVINSFYTTAAHEVRGKVEGIQHYPGRLHRLPFLAERWWVRHRVSRDERQAYQQSDLVLLNYESVRQLLLSAYGPGAEVRRLPYSTETAFTYGQQQGKPPVPASVAALEPKAAPLLVSVSRHDPRKGLDILLHALAKLRAGGTPFRACLVSGGPLLEQNRRLAERLALTDVTVIAGWVPDPYPYLNHADVFVLPSLEEGSGSVSLIEALQAGVAVVASDVDGIPEDVADGDSALLVAPGDPAALSHALSRVLTDESLRKRLARWGQEVFQEKFSPEVFATALGQTYASLDRTPAVGIR